MRKKGFLSKVLIFFVLLNMAFVSGNAYPQIASAEDSAYEKLLKRIEDQDLSTRLEEEEDVFKELLSQLEDKDFSKRKEALELLERICYSSVSIIHNIDWELLKVSLLKFIKKEQVSPVKSKALADFLMWFEDSKDLDYLDMFKEYLTCLSGSSSSDDVMFSDIQAKDKIFYAINENNDKIKGQEIFSILNQQMKQERSEVRCNELAGLSLYALGIIGRFRTDDTVRNIADVIYKAKQKNNYLERDFIHSIGELKMKEGLGFVHSALKSQDMGVRDEAAIAAGLLGEKESIPYLLDFLRTYGLEGSFEVLISLGNLDARESLPVIIEQIELTRNSYQGLYATVAACVIEKLNKKEEGLRQLKPLLNHENEYVRMYASGIIETLNKKDSSDGVLDMIKEKLSLK